MLCHRKPMFWVLLLVTALLGGAAHLLTDGAIRVDANGPSDQVGQYASIEEYLLLQADRRKTESLSVWKIPFVVIADDSVEATVIDRKLEFLKHYQELGQYRTEKMRNKGKCGKI